MEAREQAPVLTPTSPHIQYVQPININTDSQSTFAATASQECKTANESSGMPITNSYVQNGPYINPQFSNIIDLPVTPSPPPFDETLESNEDADPVPASKSHIVTREIEQESDAMPSVPLSHLITSNQYPSLNKLPPANIAQSFAPVYAPTKPQPSNECEIYSDYLSNPYNLTLHVAQQFTHSDATHTPCGVIVSQSTDSNAANATTITSAESASATSITTTSSLFQSMNYFGTADSTTIPPGSEMLFGGP